MLLFQGSIRHDQDDENGDRQGQLGQFGAGPSSSVFDALNNKLKDAGLPNFNIGEHVIEPIVYIGFLLAFVLLGVKGIIFGLVLFVISKLSSGNGGLGQLINSFFGGAAPVQGGSNRGSGNRLGGRVIRRR